MKDSSRFASLGRPVCALLVVSSAALSQAPPTGSPIRAALYGFVRDSAGTPIPMTRISVGTHLTFADTEGQFRLDGLSDGNTRVLVRRLGFEPVDVSLQLVAGHTDSLAIVMSMLPHDLPGLTSTAATDTRLIDFYRHKQGGIGYYFDRQEIESRRVQRISDLLRRVPGTRMMNDRGGRAVMRMSRSAGGRDCPPDVWVDGVRAVGMNIDDMPLTDVEALELYRGPAGIPPEINNRMGNPACGAVIIWTRLPG